MKSRVTIKDIAQKTGFSVTTISLVLNDKANHIPRETKLIIAKAVKEMGYRPNKMAVGLVKKQSNIIGFVLPDIRNQFFSYTAKVLEDECHKYDWNLLICNSDNNHKQELKHLKMLCDYMVDGIFLSMAANSTEKEVEETINFLEDNKIPYCLIDRDMFDIGKYKISVDHLQGAYLATKHLIKLGHKKIGCITGPLILDDARQRLAGYKQALKDNGIKIDENLIFEGDYSFEKGKIGCDDLLAKNITAIFAANDFSAMGALASIKEHNLVVPRDISIVGYDDIAFASLLEVPLTTIRQPIEEIGQKATEVIELLVNSENDIKNKIVILEPKLIVRNSTKAIS
ncbi:LacI family DNA-binding transcriptional regulator [Megamonas funiformis]|jgi:hypothetical protein|uniref:LacI family DNA-binding transcriptional regulator n=1 Tax=Megamonas funiformis TaxID=437897 RepID=UPI001CD4B239|nr:LacI family DNA-binding transcriptional regulator [Megamonas funiformis]UBS48808.1 LacI family transcriptional regulator [Megamonas funiformis]GLU99645.1 LacI family transcriptional regulator [Megamonas funiformis]